MSVPCKCGKVASNREMVGPCGQRAWRVSWEIRAYVCECGRYYPLTPRDVLTKAQVDWIRHHNNKVTANENRVSAG